MQLRPLPALRDVHRGTAQDQHPDGRAVGHRGTPGEGVPGLVNITMGGRVVGVYH